MEYNEELVREAIIQGTGARRTGRIMYTTGCSEIADVATKIAELVPEANVAYAHGQMKETRTGRYHVRVYQRGDRCACIHDDH